MLPPCLMLSPRCFSRSPGGKLGRRDRTSASAHSGRLQEGIPTLRCEKSEWNECGDVPSMRDVSQRMLHEFQREPVGRIEHKVRVPGFVSEEVADWKSAVRTINDIRTGS